MIYDSMTGLMCNEWFVAPGRDHRRHMLSRVTDVDVAVKHCRKTAVAVQAGGYIGMWPIRMAKFFSIVHTFEPVPANYECLEENVKHIRGVVTHRDVLSDKAGQPISMKFHKMWGSHVIDAPAEADGDIVTGLSTTIDTLELPVCDLIYLDIEGHEIQALKGAAETIKRCKPVITLEVWEANRATYNAFMLALGYVEQQRTHSDVVYVPS